MNHHGTNRTFGVALKAARLAERVTLREVADYIGVTISYISDIEQNRKGPPDLDKVRQIESLLKVKDGSLVLLASKLRTKVSPAVTERIQTRPRLEELLTRTDALSDEQLEELIARIS